MNNFCIKCKHRNIPNLLKSIFNRNAKITFIECPTNDKKIAGCLIKRINIDWKNFFNHALLKGLIKDNELSKLEKDGWGLSNRKGGFPPI